MSTQMSIFKNGGGLPVHLQKKELSASTKALMGGFAGRRISIRGGVFRMVINGQEVAISQDRHMNIVIVAVAPRIARHFYRETYQEGVTAPPDCWSVDGETPDPHSPQLQSVSCATCPQNIAGSGLNDRRACRYLQRIAVVPESHLEDGDIYEMSLAATSLFGKGGNDTMPMQQYARFLGGHGVDIESVVTEIRFDLDSATPKLVFSAVRPLDMDELNWVSEYSESPEAVSAITYSSFVASSGPTEKPTAPLYKEPQPAPQPVADTPAPIGRRTRIPRGTGTAPVNEAPAQEAAPQPEPIRRTRGRQAASAPVQEPIAEPIKQEINPPAKPVTDIDAILREWAED